jgi:hypothetical protein
MTYISADLRRLVIQRADNCCEYCLLNQADIGFTFHIDHAIAEKHGGETVADNLCLSCPHCNSFKGSDLASLDPVTRQVTALYNPRQQTWSAHFRLDGARIEALTPEGRVTVALLRMNHAERITEREALIQLGHYPCQGQV